MAKKKTADYDRRANIKYLSKFDTFALRLPKGYRERANACGLTIKALSEILQKEIEKREAETGGTDTE